VAWRWNKKNVSCVSPIKRKKGDSWWRLRDHGKGENSIKFLGLH
jgi:hypothetical protein